MSPDDTSVQREPLVRFTWHPTSGRKRELERDERRLRDIGVPTELIMIPGAKGLVVDAVMPYIAGIITLPRLCAVISDLVCRHGRPGVIVDARKDPLTVRKTRHLPGGVAVVIDQEGKATTNDVCAPGADLAALITEARRTA